jgi:apolipoprotein N-acyltransferase
VPVLPLICRDAVDPNLAIAGARLGAQAILTMSNDAWFSDNPLGARMHQTLAAFRSIETRLPQFRVTTNGNSAVIDATGTVLAGTRMGERTLVIASVPVRSPARTLMVMWGDWVGRAAALALLALGLWSLLSAWRPSLSAPGKDAIALPAFPMTVSLMPPAARLAAGLCHVLARIGLLAMCLALLINEPLRTNTLGQVRMFVSIFLLPQMAAWCLLYLYSARASVAEGQLTLARGARHIVLALADITQVQPWRLPWPCTGLSLRLASGQRWHLAVGGNHAHALARAMTDAGAPAAPDHAAGPRIMLAYARASSDRRPSRLDHPLAKYVLLPLALAIPAFHLQQHIAYGGAFGEYYSFGLKAYLSAFALWWAAWSIGVVLSAALLRAAIETSAVLATLWRPGRSAAVRRSLERGGHVALFLGLPGWLLLTVYNP